MGRVLSLSQSLLDAGKKYEQIKQELMPPQPQTPAEPPVPVMPPAELKEMRAAIKHLEAGLLQTGEEVEAERAALTRAGERIDIMRKDLIQTVNDVVGVSRKLTKVDEEVRGCRRRGDTQSVLAGTTVRIPQEIIIRAPCCFTLLE